MKEKKFKIWTLLAAILYISTAGAQVSTYERTPGYYTFGINGGLAYQQGDIPTTLEGYGLGFTLAKNLYYQPGSLLSFDIRGRALYSQTKGQDYFRSYGIHDNDGLNGNLNLDYTKEGGGPGFVFQNNKTDHAELGLEGVINFNKLREQTNVNLSLFGGIGIDWYNVKTDQADRSGLYTDEYLGIDTLGSISFTKDQLKSQILDGRYETNVFENKTGKIGLMPSLGVELGYQFTPRFSMGLGHKVTFTKTDLFDGHQWRDNGNLTAEDDIHHYTNLHMRWIIDDNSKKLREPLVDITNPSLSPHTSRNSTFDIRADVKHVKNNMDIQFSVNGQRTSFNYKKGKFKSLINLRPGNNEVVITATNAAGSASDFVNIYYQEPIIDDRPTNSYPIVDITNPPYDEYRTDEDRFNIRAEVRNVDRKRDIEFSVNGRNISNFDFSRGSFRATINLREGRNTIRIGARNNNGFDSDETTIILEEQVSNRPPSVNITKPSVDPYATSIRKVTIEAKIYNIDDKRDIRYTIDGYDSNDFTFSNNVFCANVTVDDYKTEVVITANNNAGQDSDDVTILWEEEEEPTIEKPVVTITSVSSPTVDPFNPDNCRSTVIATILNVEDRNNIDVFMNGQHITDYDFNPNTQVFQTTVRLAQGTNTIRVVATNNAGSDEDTATAEGCIITNNEEKLPVVTITQPGNDNQKFTTPKATIKADVLNITSKNDITFELNGKRTNNFSFDKFTKVITANITLEKGNNTVYIEAQNNDGTANDQINLFYEQIVISRPPKVTIERPANNSTTTKANVELFAKVLNVSTKNGIKVSLNGRNISNFSFNKSRQEVSASLTLKQGNNTIKVVGTNDTGRDEASVNVTYSVPVVKAPKVEITKPENGITVATTKVSLTANIDNVRNKRDLTVTVNGRSTNNFSFNGSKVSATIGLRAGTNIVIVKATTEGGSDQDKVTVLYDLPKPKVPTVDITIPQNNTTVKNANARIRATVLNIVNSSGIIFTVNGKKNNAFNFQRGQFTADIKLVEGKNTVKVKARNADGEAEDQVIINYKKPAAPPTVKITSPKNNQGFGQPKAALTAQITNIANKRGLTLKVNGKLQNFNYQRGKLTANVILKTGKNSITVKATNKGGSDEDRITLVYTPTVEVPKPVVKFTSPSKAGTTTQVAKFALKASVKNVKDKKDITVKLNGRPLRNFSFNKRTSEVSATVTLSEGSNKLFIEAINASGKDKDQSSITLKKIVVLKLPPKVTISSLSNPTVDPFHPDQGKSTIIARLENITSKRGIVFKFNGKKISNYSFNKNTGILQATLDLKKGKNTFYIKVSNKDGSDEASKDLQFGGGSGTGGANSRHGNPKKKDKSSSTVSRNSRGGK